MDNERRNPLEDEIAAKAAKKIELEAQIARLESIINEVQKSFARIANPQQRQQAEAELEPLKREAAQLRRDLESLKE